MYVAIKRSLSLKLSTVSHISITTDFWMTKLSTESMISLTGHWVSDSFEQCSALLHCSPFHIIHTHTGETIAETVNKILDVYSLREKVHVVVCDDVTNMIKWMELAQLHSLGCMAYTLQLSVNTDLQLQRAQINMMTTNCRTIAGHFN